MLFMHHVCHHGSQIFFGHPKFLYARWMLVKYQGLAMKSSILDHAIVEGKSGTINKQ